MKYRKTNYLIYFALLCQGILKHSKWSNVMFIRLKVYFLLVCAKTILSSSLVLPAVLVQDVMI